jgi:hypothetical protein
MSDDLVEIMTDTLDMASTSRHGVIDYERFRSAGLVRVQGSIDFITVDRQGCGTLE